MKIFDSQMEQLSRERRDHFIAVMIEAAREDHPEQTQRLTDAELRVHIEEAMAAAHRYGIEMEGDIEAYVHLTFKHGLHFDNQLSWAHQILNRGDFTGPIRIDLLVAADEGRIPPPGNTFLP